MTPSQKDCLEIIRGFIAEHGFSPSIREIGAGLNETSTQRVFDLVAALDDQGFITRRPGKARSIEIVEPIMEKMRGALEEIANFSTDPDSARLAQSVIGQI
ncbi:MAG: hypothetical protein IH994_06030 [Proteobacteria bacterium]|nr:hypothetical protein [Pseudomonadota bacterium]